MRSLALSIFLLAAGAATAHADTLPCFKFRTFGQEACREEAAIAKVGGTHYLVWGGKESRGCDTCTRMVTGSATGGLYDATGRLVEGMSLESSPGPRVGAQGLWNGAAFFVWGGATRRNERWIPSEDGGGHHETVLSLAAPYGAYYIPGARRWTKMSSVAMPPVKDSVISENPRGGVRVCWSEGCKTFDMNSNSWGPLE